MTLCTNLLPLDRKRASRSPNALRCSLKKIVTHQVEHRIHVRDMLAEYNAKIERGHRHHLML